MKKILPKKMEGVEEASNIPPNGQSESKFISKEKLRFGFSFSASDGEAGNQTEDNADLPTTLQGVGHSYNPNLSEQNPIPFKEENEITKSMHIADKHSVGLSYSDEDLYLDPQ